MEHSHDRRGCSNDSTGSTAGNSSTSNRSNRTSDRCRTSSDPTCRNTLANDIADKNISRDSTISGTTNTVSSDSIGWAGSITGNYYVPPPWGLTKAGYDALGTSANIGTLEGPAAKAGGTAAAAALPHAVLQVIRQGITIESFRLEQKPYWVIGSNEQADIYYPHPCVSRRHLVLQYSQSAPHSLYAVDLGSSFGTCCNGNALPARQPLLLLGPGVPDAAASFVPYTQTDSDSVRSSDNASSNTSKALLSGDEDDGDESCVFVLGTPGTTNRLFVIGTGKAAETALTLTAQPAARATKPVVAATTARTKAAAGVAPVNAKTAKRELKEQQEEARFLQLVQQQQQLEEKAATAAAAGDEAGAAAAEAAAEAAAAAADALQWQLDSRKRRKAEAFFAAACSFDEDDSFFDRTATAAANTSKGTQQQSKPLDELSIKAALKSLRQEIMELELQKTKGAAAAAIAQGPAAAAVLATKTASATAVAQRIAVSTTATAAADITTQPAAAEEEEDCLDAFMRQTHDALNAEEQQKLQQQIDAKRKQLAEYRKLLRVTKT